MRRIVFLALALVGLAASARAQFSIYVTSSSAHFTNVQTGVVSNSSGSQEQYASYWTSGIGGGVSTTFLPLGPVKLGFDFRGSTRPGTPGADTGMLGIKLAINPPAIRIKPYLEAAGGYVGTRTTNVSAGQASGSSFTNKYAGWEVLGGLDYPLVHFVDFRVIELGGGTAVSIPGTSSGPDISLFTVNTGLVFHF